MIPAIRIIALLCLVLTALQGQAQSPLEVQLTIPGHETTEFPIGEGIPLEVTIRNISGEDVYVLPPLDGSMLRLRYPEYQPSVKQPLEIPGRYPGLLCGTVAFVREEDFIHLNPGESTETMYFAYSPLIAGIHEIAYEIKFDADLGGYGMFEPELQLSDNFMEMFEKIPKVDLLSNQVTVQVVSNGITLDPNYHCLMGMSKTDLLRIYYYELRPLTENPNIFRLPVGGIWPRLHFTPDDIVDGVEIVRYSNSTSSIFDDYTQWVRGDDESIPQRIDYDEEGISAIRAGYFADPSGVPDYQTYR